MGAGPSGLAQLRAFESARKSGLGSMPEIVCYEKQSDLGGMWNYTCARVSTTHGEPVHGSMYRFLWSNGREGVPGVRRLFFRGTFGPTHSVVSAAGGAARLHHGPVDQYDVRKYIRFDTAVRWVERVPTENGSDRFAVTVADHRKDVLETGLFDHVVVQPTFLHSERAPFRGIEDFPDASCTRTISVTHGEFTGKRLLLIGSRLFRGGHAHPVLQVRRRRGHLQLPHEPDGARLARGSVRGAAAHRDRRQHRALPGRQHP
ncbi:hypothetical protein GS426_16015 [Rhodococcus hoagii]|nr:hypothetical protein [Prescottella equi]